MASCAQSVPRTFPHPPASAHFVGIGGIGMSGVAQFLRWAGHEVSGSDRALDNPENAELFARLRRQGVRLFPQDGSYAAATHPACLVYSTAIEDDNPDFIAGADIEKWHRADTLSALVARLSGASTVAVTGSCGKTTVTSMLADALTLAGEDPVAIVGGMVKSFETDAFPGNFRPGKGAFAVFEADESDKSLLTFEPDYSLVLNIGTDHYSKEELVEVFEKFLRRTKRGAVVESGVLALLAPEALSHLEKVVVIADGDGMETSGTCWRLGACDVKNGKLVARFESGGRCCDAALPVLGRHNAFNAMAVVAAFELLGLDPARAAECLGEFKGTARRFDLIGVTSKGAVVYDDYAHNVEKIRSCVRVAQEASASKVVVVFQPHGFKPLGFMREELFTSLELTLRSQDRFVFLPVFYAGGRSSFTPTSDEVCAEYVSRSPRRGVYRSFPDRAATADYVRAEAGKGDIILIMGARDNSLPVWAASLGQ